MYFLCSDVWNRSNEWKTGNIVEQSCSWLFWISPLISISTLRLSTKITTRDFPTQNSTPVPNRDTLSYKDCISHNLQHHHTGILLSSLQHTLKSTTIYTDCLSELLTLPAVWSDNRHRPGTEFLVWTPTSGPVFISSRSKSQTTRTREILISVQRPQMTSAVNIRMAFIAKEPACN